MMVQNKKRRVDAQTEQSGGCFISTGPSRDRVEKSLDIFKMNRITNFTDSFVSLLNKTDDYKSSDLTEMILPTPAM